MGFRTAATSGSASHARSAGQPGHHPKVPHADTGGEQQSAGIRRARTPPGYLAAARTCIPLWVDCSSRTSSGNDFRISASAGSGTSGARGATPGCGSTAPPASRRRFCSPSSFLSFRICTVDASRRRRPSSASMPFLKFRLSLLGVTMRLSAVRARGLARKDGRGLCPPRLGRFAAEVWRRTRKRILF